MATTYKDQILEQVPASSTLTYTAPSVLSAHIVYGAAHNESSSDVTITVNIVQNGGSPDVTNQYIKKSISPDDTLNLSWIVGRIMNTGDTIYATASSASSINLSIGIKEITS